MIRIRSILTAKRHAIAAVGVIVALGAAVALAHGAPGQDHMGGMSAMDDLGVDQSAVVSMCLAVLEVGAVGAVLMTGRLLLRHLAAAVPRTRGTTNVLAPERRSVAPRARAGPELLQVYRL